MASAPIRVYDRYRGDYFEEDIFGEGALRFAYETGAGRMLARAVFSRAIISRLFGWYMRRPASQKRIVPFIEKYRLDPAEFALPVEAFQSFNDFFCRELKAGSRPVDNDPGSVVFPADGRHFGWNAIGVEQGVFVKGQSWDLRQLLDGRPDLIERFAGGSLVLSRLCPVDYHHFHYPVGGTPGSTFWTGKALYSVSPIALRRQLDYLWTNKRCLTLIEDPAYGSCCFIEIGATNVGSIRHRDRPASGCVSKGDPKGWFEFGGSSVVTIFMPGRVSLSQDLVENTCNGIELYGRVGDCMGRIL